MLRWGHIQSDVGREDGWGGGDGLVSRDPAVQGEQAWKWDPSPSEMGASLGFCVALEDTEGKMSALGGLRGWPVVKLLGFWRDSAFRSSTAWENLLCLLSKKPENIVFQGFWCYWWVLAAAAAKSLQSCPTLCDPTDSSPPGSPVPGILQARTLEWVDISFSHAWKWRVKDECLGANKTMKFGCWNFCDMLMGNGQMF